MKYCLIGKTTKEPLSYRGLAIVHDNRAELEFLFPNQRVAPLPKYYDEGLTIPLTEHPDIKGLVQFPLEQHMKQFKK
jgi:hypothetical protein